MRAKGPFFILFIGIVGLVALGLMAMFLGDSPAAAEMRDAQDEILRAFSFVEHAAVTAPKGGDCAVILRLRDGAHVNTSHEVDGIGLPYDLRVLPGICRRTLGDPLRRLDLRIFTADGDTPEWTRMVNLHGRDEAITKEVQEIVGQAVKVNVRANGGLGVHLKKSVPTDVLARAAKALAPWGSGGWKQIEFNMRGDFYRYDGEGNPTPK